MSHYADTDLLIIKLMPSAEHEEAHLLLGQYFFARLTTMGIPPGGIIPLGSTKFLGRRSSKEGDSAYKPRSRNKKTDWPTIVFESGLSESLSRLRSDAHWWLTHSGGEVKTVVIISIRLAQRDIRVEKGILAPPTGRRRTLRANANANALVPTKVQQIAITPAPATPPNPTQGQYVVTGTPLVLEFDQIFLRPPVAPEGDVIFTATDLSAWAADFWNTLE
jgi:hypothetical protein